MPEIELLFETFLQIYVHINNNPYLSKYMEIKYDIFQIKQDYFK